ncbi:MAG TPA: MotA/TolQ/ExbB proton channel family protein [Solirubrobacteraceae bacterium]|nr:MotA/TolQ/ExbB proton channel family protein [Solirubrobacteraceae bacterium]
MGLLAGASMEGTPLGSLFNVPAILIIFGGLAGASLAASGMEGMKLIPTLYKKALNAERPEVRTQVDELVGYAERARRDGLLALEEELDEVEDAYTRKGLQLVVDGTPPDLVREILQAEVHGMRARHRAGAKVFENAGGFAPTMGVLGTVMGLISALQKLDQPETLGPAISGAFIATLLGVGAANIVLLPVALRLKQLSEGEVQSRVLVLEGILAIQSGDNPRVIEEKLISFVPPGERQEEAEEQPEQDGPQLRAVEDDEAMAA